MKSIALYGLLALLAAPIPYAAEAAITRVELNIPRQPLDAALNSFSEQTHIQVARMSDQGRVPTGDVGPLSGAFEPKAALADLLKNTGLGFQFINPRMVRIYDPSAVAARATTSEAKSDSTSAREDRTGSSGEFRVAQVGAGQDSGAAAVASASSQGADNSSRLQLEEIVVTAQKREERLQDVPVPVTAISAQTLAEYNDVRLEDYYTRVPGLSVTPSDFGGAQLTIRGLTTGGFTNPTVGITVDDVPYGSSSGLGSGQEVPDFDPSDLARIEVLRGPQGTLYGASSIGGLLKYVTIDPSMNSVSGQIQAGTDSVHNGNDLGYNFRGSVNVPLSDTAAIRASGFARRDAGYVDDPTFHQEGVNQAYVSGGHVALLWHPAQSWSVKLSALLQRGRAEGSSFIDVGPGFGDLQQQDAVGSGGYDKTFQAYSATVRGNIGISELTSVTGYSINRSTESIDYTSLLGVLTDNVFGVAGTPVFSRVTTRKFTQELRLSTPLGTRVDWLLGLFYNHEDSNASEDINASDEATGERVGQWLHVTDPSTFAEYAVFTDVTFRLTDQFDVQLGGRESKNRQAYNESFVGPYAALFLGGSPFAYPEQHTKDKSFTYLVTPRFRISPDLMLYARFASGYRPGGPNVNTSGSGLPIHYNPDTTHNYELGLKGNLANHALSYDASIYYIDWRNIQLQLVDLNNGIEFFANGSRAKSEGVEASLMARPWNGFSAAVSASWDDAVLTEPLPANEAVGSSGDRLPYSSRFTGNIALDQEFPLAGILRGFFGASLGFTGDRLGVFPTVLAANPTRQKLGGYVKADLRAGAIYDTWKVNVYATNVTDKRGALTGGLNTILPNAFYYIQPRTVGVTVTKEF